MVVTDPVDEFNSLYLYVGNDLINFVDPDGESTAHFDGRAGKIYIYSSTSKLKYEFDAHNNTTNDSRGKWQNGVYKVMDETTAHMHGDDVDKHDIKLDSKDGVYGENGILRASNFTQTDGKLREGMGIHAGRANKNFKSRVTLSCIRVISDKAMKEIIDFIKEDQLRFIAITNNLNGSVRISYPLRTQSVTFHKPYMDITNGFMVSPITVVADRLELDN